MNKEIIAHKIAQAMMTHFDAAIESPSEIIEHKPTADAITELYHNDVSKAMADRELHEHIVDSIQHMLVNF